METISLSLQSQTSTAPTCLLTMAPSWLPRGRLWKYFSDSSSGSFSTDPSTLTYIPHDCQLEHANLFITPVLQHGSFNVLSWMKITGCISVVETQSIVKSYHYMKRVQKGKNAQKMENPKWTDLNRSNKPDSDKLLLVGLTNQILIKW